MKHIPRVFALAALGLGLPLMAAPALAADVGVSVSVGQPGFYGRLDIGDYPAPRVYSRQPMVVERGEQARDTVYLRVPPGHRRHWRRHCGEYNACGQQVYFVQDGWYNNVYAPQYQERHGDGGHDGHHRGHRGDHRGDRGNNNHGDRHGDHGNDRGGDRGGGSN